MAASEVHVMEKTIHQLQQQQQQPPPPHETLKCPRCDSSNTKFCYYNNYSLSQPRHFCKACKRYWTRGGTLRNVPVGGGCRKNKRVKRPITNNNAHVSPTTTTTQPQVINHYHTNPNPNYNNNNNHDQNQIIPSSATTSNTTNSNHHLNPLFYGLIPQNPNFPRFDTRVHPSENLVSGYGHIQPHMNVSGLGFSPLGTGGSLVANHDHHHNSNLNYAASYNSFLYGGGSTSSSNGAPTMASLLASTLNQQQRVMGFGNYDGSSNMVKDLKLENSQNKMEWNNNNNDFHGENKSTDDQIDQAVGSSDPNSILWDAEGGGWLDPTNSIGSSVPSLI